jgi:YebC/PmpR family DNA-binding regulatory protein
MRNFSLILLQKSIYQLIIERLNMSGHSKWAQIKRQKGANDQKRGQTFTKLSNAITIAVKQGGGVSDPDQNFRLRLAIDAARASNMPKENIERAIKRAAGKDAGDMTEVVYEGFAPNGVSVIIEAATDNPVRTSSEIKNVFTKNGGSFGQPGSVSYQFNQVGQIIVVKNGKTFEQIFEAAVNAGAQDLEEADDIVFVYTTVADLVKVKTELESSGFTIESFEIARKPVVPIEVSDPEQLSKIENFLEAMEQLEDVQKVFTNLS